MSITYDIDPSLLADIEQDAAGEFHTISQGEALMRDIANMEPVMRRLALAALTAVADERTVIASGLTPDDSYVYDERDGSVRGLVTTKRD